MNVVVNGEPREIEPGTTVDGLLRKLGVRGDRVAVEVNLEVIRRDRRAEHLLAGGDRVEIVSFVGGG
jgi:thiamine biosynthesis protein ThiS